MRTFILLTISSLSLFGCDIQTLPPQVSTTDTSVPTPNIIFTATSTSEETGTLPTIFPSSTPEETEVVPTSMPSPFPNGIFYFGATPPMSQVGGMSGVAYRPYVLNETCPWVYNILRFYEDGLVMDVPACEGDNRDFLENIWPGVSKWLNRENDDPTMSRGIYQMAENQIWFTTTAEDNTVVSDYFGTFSEDRLILNSYSHYNGHQATEQEFIFFEISGGP